MKHVVKFTEYLKEELVSSPNVRTEIIKLVGEGDVRKLDRFLDENNVDVDYDSGMILVLAAKQGKFEVVKYLDEVGADFQIRRNLALKTALVYGHVDVAEFILQEYPLDVEEVDDVKEYVETSPTASNVEKRQALSLLDTLEDVEED